MKNIFHGKKLTLITKKVNGGLRLPCNSVTDE
jgi:hypothetical protein